MEQHLWGGIFNVERSFNCHTLDHYLKSYRLVFIIWTSPTKPQSHWLLQIDHLLLTKYHGYNAIHLKLLNQNIRFEEVPEFLQYLPSLRLSNCYLQAIQVVHQETEQQRLPRHTDVHLIYSGELEANYDRLNASLGIDESDVGIPGG